MTEQTDRYQRQTALPEIGPEGQRRLAQARVLIVGVGGLGSPIALYLAAAGVGTLGLADDDCVSLSNLQRQVLYAETEVGQPKAECAARRLRQLNSGINAIPLRLRLTEENARRIIGQFDLVVDGCDNFATRYVLSDACQALHIPYIYGAIGAHEGQVSVFCHGPHPRTYRDLYPNQQDAPCPAPPPVIGTIPAVVGSVEANEALKLIAHYGEPLSGKLWTIDLKTMQSYVIEL